MPTSKMPVLKSHLQQQVLTIIVLHFLEGVVVPILSTFSVSQLIAYNTGFFIDSVIITRCSPYIGSSCSTSSVQRGIWILLGHLPCLENFYVFSSCSSLTISFHCVVSKGFISYIYRPKSPRTTVSIIMLFTTKK